MGESSKKTLVLGATTNPARYAHLATLRLQQHGFEVVPVGIRDGHINGVPILLGMPVVGDVHTVTLYLNPYRQVPFYEYILELKPQRIIFNPGTENSKLMALARKNGIKTEVACTLVMLSLGHY